MGTKNPGFNPNFVKRRMVSYLERICGDELPPLNAHNYTTTYLWWLYNPNVTRRGMHHAYPGWWMPDILCTDPGPLDASEP